MTAMDELLAGGAPPLVAILRGVRPDEVSAIGQALVDAGIMLIEVPLNSPEALESIRRLVDTVGDQALCGAGTVLSVDAVEAVEAAGGRLIVTPNTAPAVISRSVALGMATMPGFLTPSEAFVAVSAGACRLKLFPSSTVGPSYLKAIREVLPKDVQVWAVGGTDADNLAIWREAGAEGIGIGSALYRAGDTVDAVCRRARMLVAAWRACQT